MNWLIEHVEAGCTSIVSHNVGPPARKALATILVRVEGEEDVGQEGLVAKGFLPTTPARP